MTILTNLLWQTSIIEEKVLLGAEFKACARETVGPRQSFIFSLAAEHSVLVLLTGDVLLPLPLTVTVPTTQTAVEATLKYEKVDTYEAFLLFDFADLENKCKPTICSA